MSASPKKPDPNEVSASYSATGQAKDARREEKRRKGVYGADAENGPGYEREDEGGGRYGLERTVDRSAEDEGSSEVRPPAAERPGRKA
ncbi:hypothetical protein [Reyranella aquatilis]|jgi:hypothetical protein|uniref:Uncharacterized protein n=1 Tax=Reyranella aquatilis TaxID=2035356 RepID=A0ABS8KTH8_9HYPH|nr:hypothetical protein [Reyranella aquatilis]MCC8429398.1 hypothetical protein [Reyranella aquatilis]